MFGETPGNPTQSMVDLEEFGKLGKSSNILTCIDSTFAGPYAQQPIKYGIDLVAHSWYAADYIIDLDLDSIDIDYIFARIQCN